MEYQPGCPPLPVDDSGWDPGSKKTYEKILVVTIASWAGGEPKEKSTSKQKPKKQSGQWKFWGHHGSPHPFVVFLGSRIPTKKTFICHWNPGWGVDPTPEQLLAVARLCLITCCLGFSSFSLFACGSSFSPGASGFKNKHIAPSEEKYLETNKLFSVLSSPQIRSFLKNKFENHPL